MVQVVRFSGQLPIRLGATDDDINKLKIWKFISNSNGTYSIHNIGTNEIINIEEEDKVCAICLVDYKNDDNLRYLLCNHHYHQECFDEWIKINASCPNCRAKVNFD